MSAEVIRRWWLTVDMLAPEDVIMSDDDTNSFVMATQDDSYLYLIPLVRHLTADEAERIVEGYMRIADHDFEIESSNVYTVDADFGNPFDYDIALDEGAKSVLADAYSRQQHNEWIQEKQNTGWRYGLNMSSVDKTHPAMRPWDDLPESYRRQPSVDNKKLVDFYASNLNKFNN
tara:strand:+ start:494 stop:1015 length:522 start_codon:yes stop_codon:yes gene_type:complete